jgi:hypothetical protein
MSIVLTKDKICTKCKIEPAKKTKNGLRNGIQLYLLQCLKCRSKRMNNHRKNNPEKYKETQIRFRKNNPWQKGLVRFGKIANWQNTRARRHGHLGNLKAEDIENLFKSTDTCHDCSSKDKLTIGHLIPLCYPISSNNIENIIRQCWECNKRQSTFIHEKVATDELRKWYKIYIPTKKQANAINLQ